MRVAVVDEVVDGCHLTLVNCQIITTNHNFLYYYFRSWDEMREMFDKLLNEWLFTLMIGKHVISVHFKMLYIRKNEKLMRSLFVNCIKYEWLLTDWVLPDWVTLTDWLCELVQDQLSSFVSIIVKRCEVWKSYLTLFAVFTLEKWIVMNECRVLIDWLSEWDRSSIAH